MTLAKSLEITGSAALICFLSDKNKGSVKCFSCLTILSLGLDVHHAHQQLPHIKRLRYAQNPVCKNNKASPDLKRRWGIIEGPRMLQTPSSLPKYFKPRHFRSQNKSCKPVSLFSSAFAHDMHGS